MSTGKEKSYPGFQVGTSFLLVIFVIICLVLLGVLALSGALRDKNYSDKAAEKTGLYYTAVSEAQHKLGEIDTVLAEVYGREDSFDMYLEAVSVSVLDLPGVVCMRDEERAVLSYKVPITERQDLCVEVEVLDPEKGEGNYKIVKWQEVSGTVWEEDAALPVLQFDEE